jgi:hypothetical protein
MDLFVSWDGDHIGRQVGRAELNNDAEGLRRISQAIEHGNQIWVSWVTTSLGEMISSGGDEGRAKIPAEHLGELERMRGQYASAVGSSVSVGVGTRLSEAGRALMAAKLRGGDQVMLYTPECEKIIADSQEKTEAEKQGEAYLGKADGPEGPKPGSNAEATPTNKASAGGGFTPGAAPGTGDVGGGSPVGPRAEGSEHSEGEQMLDMADNTESPEGTHAAADFEDEMHSHAQEQSSKDEAAEKAGDAKEDARSKIVEILTQVKQLAPQLEQLRDQAPELYQAQMAMIQALMLSAQTMLRDEDGGESSAQGDTSAPAEDSSPVQKSEIKKAAELETGHPDTKGVKSKPVGGSSDWQTDRAIVSDGLEEGHPGAQVLAEGKQTVPYANPVKWVGPKGGATKAQKQTMAARDANDGLAEDNQSDPAASKPNLVVNGKNRAVIDDPSDFAGDGAKELVARANSNRFWNEVRNGSFPAIPDFNNASFVFGDNQGLGGGVHGAKPWMGVWSSEGEGRSRVGILYDIDPATMRAIPNSYGNPHHVQHINAWLAANSRMYKAEIPASAPAPQPLHDNVEGFMAGLKQHPPATPARGKFITAHMNHGPFLLALNAHPQGPKIHAMLTQFMNSRSNAGFRAGATQAIVKEEGDAGSKHHYKLEGDALIECDSDGKSLGKGPVNGDALEKVSLTTGRSHLNLPIGATKGGKVKVTHEGGKAGWVSVRAGQVLSNDGHSISSRNPGGK